MKLIRTLLILLTILSLQYCNSSDNKTEKLFSVSFKTNITTYKSGDKIDLHITNKNNVKIDSINYSINGENALLKGDEKSSYYLIIPSSTIGIKTIIFEIFSENKSETHSLQVNILSDITPKEMSFRVINTYPHEINSYTQGLEYKNDTLYEGTGLYGESKLQKVRLKDNKIYSKTTISEEYFGEGITIVGDTIFQLTWKEQTGFLYNRKTLEKIGSFSYSTEGWGLCYDGQKLIMSDGSNQLFFYSPSDFTLIGQITVRDNRGDISHLNELEFIDGFVYANIYTTNYIVKIDPSSGKILERINLSGILKQEDMHYNIDVLNGIAYDNKEKRIFVTGKNWPKLFEVEFKEANSFIQNN